MLKDGAFRGDIIDFALIEYGTEEEYLWLPFPNYAVLRHPNGKWYGIIMDVAKAKLGICSDGKIDVLVAKCDAAARFELSVHAGFLPAYHLNRQNWITVLLDGSVPKELIFRVLDNAYKITGLKSAKQKLRTDLLPWIIPVNPKYFDLNEAFSQNDEIIWKQSNNLIVGDTVYLYIAAPISAIRYRCRVTAVNIPYDYDDGKIRMNRVMKIELQKKLPDIGLSILKEHGVVTVRGPVKMPYGLECEISNLNGCAQTEKQNG